MTTSTGSRPTTSVDRTYATDVPSDTDYFGVFADVTPAEREYWMTARRFVTDDVLPIINDYWERADYPFQLVQRMGELDLLREGIPMPGYPERSDLELGLASMEIARGDGSVSTISGVQGGLAMRSIHMLGSDEQRESYLPPMARGELLGAFALTEPTHGSDSVSLETTAVRDGDDYVITGSKKWIGNGSAGGITVVWARCEDGGVGGFIVPQESPGYDATTITGKLSLRAIWQALISLDEVRVPAANRLPGGRSFKDTSAVLTKTRLGVAWEALGHATAGFDAALAYAAQREQFGKRLAQFQLIQARLTTMLADLSTMQLMVVQATRRDADGLLTGPQASMAKMHCTRTARKLLGEARDLLGGNGILLENHVARHLADVEAVHTYEGTESVQQLIVGRDLTGFSAFA